MRLYFGLIAAMLIAVGAPARAGYTLDQSYLPSSGPGEFDAAIGTGFTLGQSFTSGLAGLLGEVDVKIDQSPGTTGGDVTLTISTLAGGVPGASLFQSTIALASIPAGGFTSLTKVDVSAGGIMVTPGEVLAITLSRTAPGAPPWVLWQSPQTGTYAGGNGFVNGPGWITRSDIDFAFQTFVQTTPVPEPSSIALCGIGFVAAVGYARRRRMARG